MTMQVLDNFTYKGRRSEAIAINRRFSFTPANNFGITTVAWATSNYRGFWCDFVIDETFVLSNLYLFSKTRDYPSINGQNAEEIPEFTNILKKINQNAQEDSKYIDGFPMQYKGINYDYDYSGRIVLGIEPTQGESGKERYQKVLELLFDKGILKEETDITELWKSACDKQTEEPEDYWWESEDNNYSDLLNYAFMGVGS